MDRAEYWRRSATTLAPFLGLIAGVWALVLSTSAIAAGVAYGSLGGYVAASGAIVSGYVVLRRAWDQRVDSVFVGAMAAVVVLTLYVVLFVRTPPSVYQHIASW